MMHLTLICLALALFASCGEDQAADSEHDLSTFAQEVAAVQCAKIFECCSQDEIQGVLGPGIEDPEQCESAVLGYVSVFAVPDVERAAADGTIVLGSASSCVKALGDQSCSDFAPSPNVDIFGGSCGDFIRPRLETSGFCAHDWECKTHFCKAGSGVGSCATPPSVGDPCASQRCGEGLFCDPNNMCVTKAVTGESCDRNEACESGNCLDQNTQRLCGDPALVCQ